MKGGKVVKHGFSSSFAASIDDLKSRPIVDWNRGDSNSKTIC
jgi:hypothetical protein